MASNERLTELEELIRAGYGDMPQDQIPKDWRTRPRPEVAREILTENPQPVKKRERVVWVDPLALQVMQNEAQRQNEARLAKLKARGVSKEMKQAAMRARMQQKKLKQIERDRQPERLQTQSERRREYLRETGRLAQSL